MNMSFLLTQPQIRDRSKTVTRRTGWARLKPWDEVNAVERGQGLKKGAHVVVLARLLVVSVRMEPLIEMIDDEQYGKDECVREGFPAYTPFQFVRMFMRTHRGVRIDTPVRRIQFDYLADGD